MIDFSAVSFTTMGLTAKPIDLHKFLNPFGGGGGGKNQCLPNLLSLSTSSTPRLSSSLTITTATKQSSAFDGDRASSFAVSIEMRDEVDHILSALQKALNHLMEVVAHKKPKNWSYGCDPEILRIMLERLIGDLELRHFLVISIEDLIDRVKDVISDLKFSYLGDLTYLQEVMLSHINELKRVFTYRLARRVKSAINQLEKSAVVYMDKWDWEIRDQGEWISHNWPTSIIYEIGSPHLAANYASNPKHEFSYNLAFKRNTGCLPSSRLIQFPCADGGRDQRSPGSVSCSPLRSSPTTGKFNSFERPKSQISYASGGRGNSGDGGNGGRRAGSPPNDNSDSSSHKPWLPVALLTFFTALSSTSLALLPFFTYCFKYLLPRNSVSHMFLSGFGTSDNEMIGLVAVVYCASLVANMTFAVLCAWLLKTRSMRGRVWKLTSQKLNGTEDSSAKELPTQNVIEDLLHKKLSPRNGIEDSPAKGPSPPTGIEDSPAKGLPPLKSNSSKRWRKILKGMSSMKLALDKVVKVIKAVVALLESLLSTFN